jgi:hypothetical protein
MVKIGSALIIISTFIGFACQSSKWSEQNVDRSLVHTVGSHPEDDVFARLNTTLFEDFLNDNYGPHAIRGEEGYMVADGESYQSYLKLINIFDQSFIDAEMTRIKPCVAALDTLKFKGEIEAEWAPEVCAFDILYWIGGHEKPSGFEVKDLKIDDAHAVSTMIFFDQAEDSRQYRKVKLIIEYGKQNDSWKVLKLGKSK